MNRLNKKCEDVLKDYEIEWDKDDECYRHLFDAYSCYDPYFSDEASYEEIEKILKVIKILI
jgi:hypothetical protein